MERKSAIFIALAAWFAVIAQFFLMMENRVEPIAETTIRFFSFFTILTNTLVAIYFTRISLNNRGGLSFLDKPGTLTAVTVYITVVGLVYQVLLRHIWDPKGLQKIVDEMLHSAVPVFTIIYWYFYEIKSAVKYRQIWGWIIYPLVYLVYILVRGSFSDFYPYPFVNVVQLGFQQVLINSFFLTLFFIVLSALFIWIGKLVRNR